MGEDKRVIYAENNREFIWRSFQNRIVISIDFHGVSSSQCELVRSFALDLFDIIFVSFY